MKTIILSGQRDSGKSFAIFHAAKWLWEKNTSYEVKDVLLDNSLYNGRNYVPENSDLMTLFDVKGKRVLFCSATDNFDCIKRLIKNLEQLSAQKLSPDILITSCRRYDSNEFNIMLNAMNWRRDGVNLFDKDENEIIQIPVLRVKYEWDSSAVINWYNDLTARLLCHTLESLLF